MNFFHCYFANVSHDGLTIIQSPATSAGAILLNAGRDQKYCLELADESRSKRNLHSTNGAEEHRFSVPLSPS